VIEFSTTEEGTEGPKIEEHLPEIDEIKTLTKQIVSEQPKDIELEFGFKLNFNNLKFFW
jgi:hypothetical protein